MNNYYQDIKIRETKATAITIATLYKSQDFNEIRDRISEIYRSNDMYIEIQTEAGIPIYVPNVNLDDSQKSENQGTTGNTAGNHANGANSGVVAPNTEAAIALKDTTAADASATPHLSPSIYRAEIENLYKELEDSNQDLFSKQVTDPDTKLITLEYATYLESPSGKDRNILYIFSPLYPMQSTIDIIQSQLIYITIIATLLAFFISFYLARRISVPIENITKSAEKLGEGEYGIVFEGGKYSEISKLAETLTYTSLELAKSDNLQKDVIANVSHDLRTPLTMITSYAEMIQDLSGGDPEKRNAHLQVIIDEAGRLNTLVTDFLEISRMQSGINEISLTTFSLKTLIEATLQSYTGFVEKEGFKLIFISSGDGVIRGDEARIKQVIDNLVTNAFKYSGRDRTVEVKMLDEQDYVRCEISDHGIGIPKKDLKYIWERYYRASSNYKRTNSTGLGLSIVKQILLLHSANFGVESALKKGSTFWFEIKKPTEEELVEAEDSADIADAADANKTSESESASDTNEPNSVVDNNIIDNHAGAAKVSKASESEGSGAVDEPGGERTTNESENDDTSDASMDEKNGEKK